jgi:hypothetical protein
MSAEVISTAVNDQDLLLPTTTYDVETVVEKQRYFCPSCKTTKSKLCHAIETTAVTVGSVLFNEIFHNPMCGMVFRCGCSFNPWLGGTGWLLCNVHNPNINSPRCPWCISPRDTPSWTWTTGTTITVTLMVASYYSAGWKFQRDQSKSQVFQCLERSWNKSMRRIVAPILYFFFHHLFVGLIFALATGYPYWLFFTLPNTQVHSKPLLPILPNITRL